VHKVFKQIIDSLPLLDEHRKELKLKRGFSDDIIDKFQFRSISKELLEKSNGLNEILPQNFKNAFQAKNILIPYFQKFPDGTEDIIYIRPHKFSIVDLPIQIYIPYALIGDDHTNLVISESEFKAIASCIYNVPTIGLPGIASFSNTKFNILLGLLESLEVKKAIICFDNEIKDNPAYPNYKEDFRKRYDTQFYAYIMARKIKEIGKIDAYIATLDSKYMINGKIDIDGLLALGVKEDDYKRMISNPQSYYEYKKTWNVLPQHRSFIERRIDRYFYEGPIIEKEGEYYNKANSKKISNFKLKILHTIIDGENKAERLVQFISKYGNSTPTYLLPDAMVSKAMFQKLCYDCGDYEFSGKDEDLMNICRYLFIHQDGRLVYKIPHYGYCENLKTWFFGNGAYCNNEFFQIDEDKIIWINDIGYKLAEEMNGLDIPILSKDRTREITIATIFSKVSKIYNSNEAKLLIGWALGNFFMPEILEIYRVYPFMFLYGKQAAGKSTTANLISSFFGFTQQGINFFSTNVGISRYTNQMSMIPIWLEEYRNKDKDIGKKNNFLRSIYDRSTIVKGSKKEYEIKVYKARSTLIISGEEHPQDAALNSRCVQFPIYRSADSEDTTQEYEWLQSNKGSFNEIGDDLLLNKKKYWPVIKDRIDSYIQSFKADGIKISDRPKIHHSILAGICDTLIGKDEIFSQYVGEKAVSQDSKVYFEQALYVFFEDVLNMYLSGKFPKPIVEAKNDEIYFGFGFVYSQWECHFKGLRNDIPASKIALMEHIKKEPYFKDTRQSRIGGVSMYCLILKEENAPEALKTILVDLKNKELKRGKFYYEANKYSDN